MVVYGHAHNRPQWPKGVPGRLRPQIFLTFGTTRVVGRQPHAPATFTPRGNPWYSFLEAESTPGHMVPSVATEKILIVTPPGIDPETVMVVYNRLKHENTIFKNNKERWGMFYLSKHLLYIKRSRLLASLYN
jgi:hypothetical protein